MPRPSRTQFVWTVNSKMVSLSFVERWVDRENKERENIIKNIGHVSAYSDLNRHGYAVFDGSYQYMSEDEEPVHFNSLTQGVALLKQWADEYALTIDRIVGEPDLTKTLGNQ